MTPSLACTGSSARWCPVCGDCACGPRYEGDGADGERTLDDAGCPLHGASSTHARDTAPDLAAQVLALADALASIAQLRADLERADHERQRVEGERDAATERHATLAAAVATVRDACAVVAATSAQHNAAWDAASAPPTASQSEGIAVALRASYEAGDALTAALDALLAAAPAPSMVPAALVREYLAASDRYEAAWAPMLVHDGPPLSDEAVAAAVAGPDAEMGAARAALDAALGRCP